ncbi:MAG: PEP-CTERM sorting domain-containing protein [Akkermansia sp.]|nr:PEP-CTERM sorting domain-containing protein [Akkermansia sp.]
MKKTLFLLSCVVASSLMVQGATVLTLDSSELQAAGGSYTLTEGINSGYGNFSVTMALDAQAFQNAIRAGDVKANIFSANNKIGLGLGYVSSETPTAGIYGSWQGGDYIRPITSVYGSELNLSTELKELFTEHSYASAAITNQTTHPGTWIYLPLVESKGTGTTYSGRDSTLKATGFGALTSFTYGTDYVKYLVVDDTNLQADASQKANLNAIAAAAVPEPVTASLSLIGLAALMMRRRRA